ncbi:hypothetical protein R1flu_000809 [Riccia fluitans]|uniref:Tubulin/FtsZ GTPase domain-containing protein n=1 Tax=Riccia fluitans TaxID=41844 RepID=A0ABD1Y2G4_9MARC
MSLLGVRSSGGFDLVAWGALGGRSGGTLRDSDKDLKQRILLLAADDFLRNDSCRPRNHGENRSREAVRKDSWYSVGLEWSQLDKNRFFPQTKIYKFLPQSVRRVSRRDFWRSEFREATEPRSFKVLNSVRTPANFFGHPPKDSCSGQTRDGSKGEMDDLEAARVPTDEAVSAGGNRDRSIGMEALPGNDVKVIGVGARACAILNFCQHTSLLPSVEFWTYGSDTALQNAQLTDHLDVATSFPATSENGDKQSVPIVHDDKSRTLFLVLGTGTGTGLGSAPRQLKAARAKGWLVVGIFIQPFTFEGQKRLEQANQLVEDLLECTDLVLVVEQDAWLKGQALTVSDATDMANNAVLLSITAISELQAGNADAVLHPLKTNGTSGAKIKSLRKSGKAWLGSGKGRTVGDAVETSVVDSPSKNSPLLGGQVSVLCTLASANGPTREEVNEASSILRQSWGSEIQLVSSAVVNPFLEPDVTLATIIITRFEEDLEDEKYPRGASSSTPLGGNNTPSNLQSSRMNDSINVKSCYSVGDFVYDRQEGLIGEARIEENNTEGFSHSNKESRSQQSRVPVKKITVRSFKTDGKRKVDARPASPQPLASSASKRSWVTLGWESGPISAVAVAWAQARADSRRSPKVVSGSDLTLPVGVRLRSDKPQVGSTESFDSNVELDGSKRREAAGPVPVDPEAVPRNRIIDMGLGAVMDMYNAASALVVGKEEADVRKQPSLTQRASSMLESERNQKKLTPMVEMEFKNGIYNGRCLAGLPDGKGRLSFSDGSFYDGQWKQGKRAGGGTFYYANGDLFQGTWKDDVMHGKGWMYYHNGDRLYANFWKGKADGEGRFYSAQGDVFFGQFRDNWRHGECLHTEASGVRWMEIWENGVFISRTPDDS